MRAATITISETPCKGVGRCSAPGCVSPARIQVVAAGVCVRASTFTCHGHVLAGHAKALRMYAQVIEDSMAEAAGEYEPVTP